MPTFAPRIKKPAAPAPSSAWKLPGPKHHAPLGVRVSGGQPLPSSERRFFEQRFGRALSNVRLHTDRSAADAARALNADAFTVRNDIAFAAGRYRPGTEAGRRLLAHELAHVVQQGDAGPSARTSLSHPGDRSERDADRAAAEAMTGGAAPVRVSPAPAQLARQKSAAGGDTIDMELDPNCPPGQICFTILRATDNPNWIDAKLLAVGYSIYLGGYHLYLAGVNEPVFVPANMVDLTAAPASPISDRIYDSKVAADAAVAVAPVAAKGTKKFGYFWGAGGAVVAPTIISNATAPATARSIRAAVAKYASSVQHDLVVVAIGIVGGMILRGLVKRIFRTDAEVPPGGSGAGATASAGRVVPVNGRINVGGGFEAGASTASNLQPGIGTSGPGMSTQVPNLVRGSFEEIGTLFEPGSANLVYSNRLPYGMISSVDQAAAGTYSVTASGGRISLNIWTSSEAEVQALIRSFQKAGFREVSNATGVTGSGTLITGIK